MDRDERRVWMGLGALAGAWLLGRAARSRRAVSFTGKTVLITGGSRGLGLVLARRFAAEGARLVLLARTATDLEKARAELEADGTEVLTVPCDVSVRAEVEAAVAQTIRRFGRLDVVVHDAGIIQVGPVEHMTESDFRNAMGVHFWAAYYLTEAALPHLPRDGSARLAYVSSFGGRVAVPHLAPYAASKFALVGYADAMRAELAKDGVAVTTITPGLLRTGSHVNAHFKGQHEKEYAWFALGDANPLLSVSARTAARQIVDAVRHGDPALTITLPAKLMAAANGAAPNLVARLTNVAGRLLPAPAGPEGDRTQTGRESASALAPSAWTAPADREVARNNEDR